MPPWSGPVTVTSKSRRQLPSRTVTVRVTPRRTGSSDHRTAQLLPGDRVGLIAGDDEAQERPVHRRGDADVGEPSPAGGSYSTSWMTRSWMPSSASRRRRCDGGTTSGGQRRRGAGDDRVAADARRRRARHLANVRAARRAARRRRSRSRAAPGRGAARRRRGPRRVRCRRRRQPCVRWRANAGTTSTTVGGGGALVLGNTTSNGSMCGSSLVRLTGSGTKRTVASSPSAKRPCGSAVIVPSA